MDTGTAGSLVWSRAGGLPDGADQVAGDQVIYSAVGRQHAGSYTCLGRTPAGLTVTDTVTVLVQCE